MGGVGLIFTPVLVTYVLGPLGLSGPMTRTSWTHGYVLQTVILKGRTSCGYPPTPIPPTRPLLYMCNRDITIIVVKYCSKFSSIG